MKSVRIGIVEDELITAEDISMMLRQCGYEVTRPAMRYSEAIPMIENEQPDLLLLDINIPGKLDGIELGRTVNQSFGIPFIFLTANSDYATISRAKEVSPAAFLTKPVTQNQLFAAIEMAMSAPRLQHTGTGKGQAASHVFINDGKGYVKIDENEILYIESEQNYIRLYLSGGNNVMTRATFSDFVSTLDEKKFIRVHRSFAVAVNKISRTSSDGVHIGKQTIPVSNTYRDALFKALHIK